MSRLAHIPHKHSVDISLIHGSDRIAVDVVGKGTYLTFNVDEFELNVHIDEEGLEALSDAILLRLAEIRTQKQHAVSS